MQSSKEHIRTRTQLVQPAYTRLAAKPWSAEQQEQQIQGCQKERFLPHKPVECLSSLSVWQSLHVLLKTDASNSMSAPEYQTELRKLGAAAR
jgi:hypothetical protein